MSKEKDKHTNYHVPDGSKNNNHEDLLTKQIFFKKMFKGMMKCVAFQAVKQPSLKTTCCLISERLLFCI